MKVHAVDHLVLTVADVAASAAWYGAVLGMECRELTPSSGGASRTSLHFGRQKINLRPGTADQKAWFTGSHPQVGSGDLCFLVDAVPDEVMAHLARHRVPVELGPTIRQGADGAICSVYCRDPDGNLIELSSYR